MNQIKYILLVGILTFSFCFSNTVTAASITSMDIQSMEKEKILLLTLQAEGLGDIRIQLLDQAQNILFAHQLNVHKSFGKKLMLDHLKPGDYSLVIEDELRTMIQPLIIDTNNLEVNKQSRQTIFKPQVILNTPENHFDINWLMDNTSDFELIVMDKKDKLYFKDKVKTKHKKAIHLRYDISKLRSGTYQLTIKNEQQVYYKTLEIQ